eukprot:NODE_1549_length_2441_cov_3.824114.p1 GENE.NODE_1549_length_2441_cov_3.824114~~NODE_1549_length_2441_cov_3.824114.p1  ORF type:complete len:373 (-),score=40.96 NODE_1549_length_2441_cov_3.824114:293-1411(-)
MECVSGTPLANFIAAEPLNVSPKAPTEPPHVSPNVRHSLLVDICCALRYLHGQQPRIVHGDLKSANVMVEHAGHVWAPGSATRAKLLDFGLSRIITRSPRPLGGTVAWMAPELLMKNKCPPEPNADVFSFGRVIYHVVTGVKPLSTMTSAEIVYAVRKQAWVPELPWRASCAFREEGRSLCGAMLQFEPMLRPNMVAVHETLLTWLPMDAFCEMLIRAESHSLKAALQHGRMALSQHRVLNKAPKHNRGLVASAVVVIGNRRTTLDMTPPAAKQPSLKLDPLLLRWQPSRWRGELAGRWCCRCRQHWGRRRAVILAVMVAAAFTAGAMLAVVQAPVAVMEAAAATIPTAVCSCQSFWRRPPPRRTSTYWICS